jgi:hypothetical protein
LKAKAICVKEHNVLIATQVVLHRISIRTFHELPFEEHCAVWGSVEKSMLPVSDGSAPPDASRITSGYGGDVSRT